MSSFEGRPRRLALVVTFALPLTLGAPLVERHVAAAAVLTRFAAPDAPPQGLARYAHAAITTDERVVRSLRGDIAVRVHRPLAGSTRGRLVVVHGMHRLGRDEPRLLELAQNLARAGIEVWTPHVAELAAYELAPASADRIGAVAVALADEAGVPRVPVMGISFAGGLSLVAASDPRFAARIGSVVAIGGHADLARVGRWYGGEAACGPNGETVDAHPHPYGAQLLMHHDPDRFFSSEDRTLATELLAWSLHDEWRRAREGEASLSAEGRVVLDAALTGEANPRIAEGIRAFVASHAEALERLSPEPRLDALDVPVFVLHGASDPIVPATEAFHLGARLGERAEVLVTPLLRHAEAGRGGSLGDELALVAFMADVLGAVDALD